MNTDSAELYEGVLLEHGRRPCGRGRLDDITHAARGHNPLCGDTVTIELFVEESGKLRDLAFEAQACAITIAAASLLVRTLRGRTIERAQELITRVAHLLDQQHEPALADLDGLGELAALAAVRSYPTRYQCALLPWRTLAHALAGIEGVATTE